MTKVSIRPTQKHRIPSIGQTQQPRIVEAPSVQINVIRNTHRRGLELGVELLVVRDFVDEVDAELTVEAEFLPRLQRLPNTYMRESAGHRTSIRSVLKASWLD
jgi:tryptophan 2,3-dioxygenase